MKHGNYGYGTSACFTDFPEQGKNILSVREEVNLLENYLQLQKVRFGEAIQVDYDLDEEL